MPGPRLGAAFPAQSLRDLDGRARDLAAAWRAGRALIAIGHRDCKTTRLTLPYVDRIARRRGAGAEAVAVLQDEADPARGLARELDLELPILLEADPYPLARALDLVTVPTLVVVGRDGRIAAVSEGFDRAALEDMGRSLGSAPPLFAPDDPAPETRPG